MDCLICGGISAELAAMTREAGIEVLANIHGPEDMLRAAANDAPVADDPRTTLDVHATRAPVGPPEVAEASRIPMLAAGNQEMETILLLYSIAE